MIVLLFFAFVSGLVTILAPCIWPILPIILSSATTGGHKKPLGITLGIMISFAVFTLSISYLVMLFHFDPNILRFFAVVVIGFLGLTMIVPAMLGLLEALVSRLSSRFAGVASGQKSGFTGGFVTGLSLGLVWSPCAGPILATIATLAATQSVNVGTVLVTLAYVTGVGIPLFILSYAGSYLFTRTRVLSKYTGRIQQVFGVLMIVTAVAIFTNYDKTIQVKLLDIFPQYENFLVQLESNKAVQNQLAVLKGEKEPMEAIQDSQDQNSLFNVNYKAPEFAGIDKWLNTDAPLTMEQLKGKVVLIDFWTYTCINCIRTLPYVTSWYDKYKEKGFVVIGVHTPEFAFEKNTQNVLNAIKQYNIHYPVAQDNDYKTWEAYQNHYWPAEYLIDAKGIVRRTHFGEGEYDKMEKAIQTLLHEAGKSADMPLVEQSNDRLQGELTPETYLGKSRMERFASPQEARIGQQTFSTPTGISLHSFAYQGVFTLQDEYAQAKKGSSLTLHFSANKVFLVVTPGGKTDTAKIYLDGKLIAASQAGVDVKDGIVVFDQPRLYELVNLKGKQGEHELRIQFQTNGTQVFAFTFG